ncbi:hypothetical protein [Microbacterium sp. NPDC087591]|uniref:hypothetical protein n=1 Tax=Microbacterium sp. NPDC087591 TaxID=3364192 RepID=UPI003816BB95
MIDSALEMPAAVEFAIIGKDATTGVGTLVEADDHAYLTTNATFSATTGASSRRVLQARIGDVPALVVGHVVVKDRELTLRVTEIRMGSDDVQPTYSSVHALFEHATGAAGYRHEDGGGRFPSAPLLAPALGTARAMEFTYTDAQGRIKLTSTEPAPLDEFEEHLAAFQDLLTFAADSPSGRLTLTATEPTGVIVTVLGRTRFAPFNRNPRKPIEYVVRLGNEHAQSVINAWWAARSSLRPVPQVLSGIRYQSGYVESDLIALAAALEKYVKTRFPLPAVRRLTDTQLQPLKTALDQLSGLDEDQMAAVRRFTSNRPVERTYREHLEVFVADLGAELMAASKINVAEWINHLLWARNDIAHEGAPNDQRGDQYVTDPESRAVRDATWVMLSLGFTKQAHLPEPALQRAAERLGVRYGSRHTGSTIFN